MRKFSYILILFLWCFAGGNEVHGNALSPASKQKFLVEDNKTAAVVIMQTGVLDEQDSIDLKSSHLFAIITFVPSYFCEKYISSVSADLPFYFQNHIITLLNDLPPPVLSV